MEPDRIRQTEELLDYIRRSPTAFQAVENAADYLAEKGFRRLEEVEPWDLRPGEGYYLSKNQSAMIAFRVPETVGQVLITASHTDSPMLKLKPNFESVAINRYLRLDTEPYGGTIYSTWLDRPLSVAGRVVIKKGETFLAKNVCLDRDLALIPNLPIHVNREVNKGYAYNPAVDLMPLFGGSDAKGTLCRMLAEQAGCDPEQIVGSDLFLYNRMPGSIWGAEREFFSAPRIDNLMCAWGTLKGFCEAEPNADSLNVWYCADNEETGSLTKQGAASAFLRDTLDRICEALGTDFRRVLANSFLVSADNAHAQHPNHPEMYDPLNVPHLGGGVVIKSNAAQKYATDGISEAIFSEICRSADVPVQHFANRSDLPGGSTLGSIANATVPMTTVDIGMAQLAMHSSYETAGVADVAHLFRAMKRFYASRIRSPKDGEWTVSRL